MIEEMMARCYRIPCPQCGVKYITTVPKEPAPHMKCVDCWKEECFHVALLARDFINNQSVSNRGYLRQAVSRILENSERSKDE